MFDLYLITDEGSPGSIASAVREALTRAAPGRVGVQLRDKAARPEELLPLARELRAITREAGAALFINEHARLARAVAADGVHLPDRALSISATRAQLAADARVGVSCHDAAGLARAVEQGADFAVLGPVFEAPGKAPPLGVARFGELVRATPMPVFALGGVGVAHISALCAAGAHGIALIRAVFAARDRAASTAACLTALDAARNRRG